MEWSKTWVRSKDQTKQRKYRLNAPIHIRKSFVRSPLSKELKEKHKKNAMTVVQGDKVKILRGQFKGHTGKVESVDLKRSKVYIGGVDVQKKDGNKTKYPIDPSNIIIQELKLDDKRRKKILERKG